MRSASSCGSLTARQSELIAIGRTIEQEKEIWFKNSKEYLVDEIIQLNKEHAKQVEREGNYQKKITELYVWMKEFEKEIKRNEKLYQQKINEIYCWMKEIYE